MCHCDGRVDNKTIWKQGKFLPLYLLLKGISIVWLYHIGLKSFKNYFKNQHFMKFLWREQSNIYKHKASEGGNKSFQINEGAIAHFLYCNIFPFLVQCVSIVGLCGHVEKEDIQSICTNYVDNVKYCGKFNLLSIKTYLVIRSDISMEVQSEGLIMYMKKNLSKKTFWNMEN